MSFFTLNPRSSLARFTVFVFLSAPVLADTVTLVDGTKIEGEVMSVTDDLVVVRAKVGGIWDERRLDAGEVRSIERESPETKAWHDVSISLPTADLLSRADYSEMIDKNLKPFLEQFPAGEHTTEAKSQLATIESELARIMAGEVKFNGAWMSAAEYNDLRYWVDAERLYRELKASVEKGSLVTALRRFDELDNDYGDSVAYSAAISEIRPVLERYDRELTNAIIRAPRLIRERTKMLETLSPTERARTEAEIERSDDEAKARAEKERADKMKWLTPNPYDENMLKMIQTTVRKELERVAKLEPAVLERRARVLELIDRTISEGHLVKAKELIAEHGELLKGSKYLRSLEEKVKAIIKAREEALIIEAMGSEDESVEEQKEEFVSEGSDDPVTSEDPEKTTNSLSDEVAAGGEESISNVAVDSPATDKGNSESEVNEEVVDVVAEEPAEIITNAGAASKGSEEEQGLSPIVIGVLVALVLVLAGATLVNAKGKKKMHER